MDIQQSIKEMESFKRSLDRIEFSVNPQQVIEQARIVSDELSVLIEVLNYSSLLELQNESED